MHGVQLQRRCAEVELAGHLVRDREVQVRVDVGDRPEPLRVVLDDREQVLERLHAGRLRAVLAEEQRHVDPLGCEDLVEPLRAWPAVCVPDILQDPFRPEARAQSSHAGRSVRSIGTWTCASTSRIPSSTALPTAREPSGCRRRSARSCGPRRVRPAARRDRASTSVKKRRLSSMKSVCSSAHATVLGDGLHRADRLAGAAVDALLGVDVELAVTLVDAVDRALLDARLVHDVDAGRGDDVGHGGPPAWGGR